MSDTSYNFNYQHLENEYIIFAIDNLQCEHETVLAERFKLWASQHNIGVKELRGRWQGNNEQSWIANARYLDRLLNTWCKHQDAVLLLGIKRCRDCNRSATLRYRSGTTIEVGEFVTVTKDVAEGLDGYTYDPSQNMYWTTTDVLNDATKGKAHA